MTISNQLRMTLITIVIKQKFDISARCERAVADDVALTKGKIMKPEITMYRSDGKRVIAFGGTLSGMMAVWDGSPAWSAAFALARRLRIKITPAYGYTGPLTQ